MIFLLFCGAGGLCFIYRNAVMARGIVVAAVAM